MKAKHHKTVVLISGQVTEISADGVQEVKEDFFTQTFVSDTNFATSEPEKNDGQFSPRGGKKHKRHRTNDDDEISDSEFEALSSYILPTPPRASLKPNRNIVNNAIGRTELHTNSAPNSPNNATLQINDSQSPPVSPRQKLGSRNNSSENLTANGSLNGSPPVAPRKKLDDSSRTNSSSGAENKSPPIAGSQSPPVSPRRKFSGSNTNMQGSGLIVEKHEEVLTVLTLDNVPQDSAANETNNPSAPQTTHKNSPKAIMTNFANTIQRAFSKSKKRRAVSTSSPRANAIVTDAAHAPTSPSVRTHKPKNKSDNARKFLKGLFQLRSARSKDTSKSQEIVTGDTLDKSQDSVLSAPSCLENNMDLSSPSQSGSTSPREVSSPRNSPVPPGPQPRRETRSVSAPRPSFVADNLNTSGTIKAEQISPRQHAFSDAHRSKKLPAPPVPPRNTKPRLTAANATTGGADDVMSDALDALPRFGTGVLSDDNICVPSRSYETSERRRAELHRSKSVATLNELLRGLDPSLLAEINAPANNNNAPPQNKSGQNNTNSGSSSYNQGAKFGQRHRSISARDIHTTSEEIYQ